MKMTKSEIMEVTKQILGDRKDDEALAYLENLSDSLEENDGEDWKTKYDELDKSWRERYAQRFFDGKKPEPITTEKDENQLTFENLFKDNESEVK